jgi:hypothetical protein
MKDRPRERSGGASVLRSKPLSQKQSHPLTKTRVHQNACDGTSTNSPPIACLVLDFRRNSLVLGTQLSNYDAFPAPEL